MNRLTFGNELRRLRQQRGLSLKKFARLTHFDPGYISKIENGIKPPTNSVARRCDEMLETGGTLSQLLDNHDPPGRLRYRRSSNSPAPYPFSAWEPDVVADIALQVTGSDLAISRRDALLNGTTALAGGALVDPLRSWLISLAPDSKNAVRGLSEDEVAAMEAATRYLRTWARQRGGGMATKTAVTQLKDMSDRLRSVGSGILRDRAFLAGAQLARLIASLAWDAGSHAEAQRYYLLSVQMAHVAQDSGYAALAIADLARQSLDLGRPGDALELVQLAQYGSRNLGVPKLHAFLFTRAAWALAHLNRPQDFRRAIGQAESLFAEREDQNCPPWLKNFDVAELTGVIGARYRDLSSADRRYASLAEQYIHQALSMRPADRIRNRTFDLISLGRVYLVMGDPEQGCFVAQQAVEVNGKALNGRPKRKLQDFCRELVPYKNTRAARSFSDYLGNSPS